MKKFLLNSILIVLIFGCQRTPKDCNRMMFQEITGNIVDHQSGEGVYETEIFIVTDTLKMVMEGLPNGFLKTVSKDISGDFSKSFYLPRNPDGTFMDVFIIFAKGGYMIRTITLPGNSFVVDHYCKKFDCLDKYGCALPYGVPLDMGSIAIESFMSQLQRLIEEQ